MWRLLLSYPVRDHGRATIGASSRLGKNGLSALGARDTSQWQSGQCAAFTQLGEAPMYEAPLDQVDDAKAGDAYEERQRHASKFRNTIG